MSWICEAQFEEAVISYFCETYRKGYPNPCIRCNAVIKFGALLQYASSLGCEKIATGHYARIKHDAVAGVYTLHRGLDHSKDQSYFLFRLDQSQLARILFPLGELTKQAVWHLAEGHRLPVTPGQESQEICFIEGDYRDFLAERVPVQPGEIQDVNGTVIGRHRGLPFYTIGQRRGLGIAAGQPLYILDFISEHNPLSPVRKSTSIKRLYWPGRCTSSLGTSPLCPWRSWLKSATGHL